jgi:hypothetical protein
MIIARLTRPRGSQGPKDGKEEAEEEREGGREEG